VLAGADTFVDIARFGAKKLDLLRRFRPFRDGTPSHDHLGDIFATLDAEHFQRCFAAWVASLTGAPEGVVAIDGKTVRRSHHGKAGNPSTQFVPDEVVDRFCLLGPPEAHIDRLKELREIGASHFSVYLMHDGADATLESYAERVIGTV